MIKAVINIEAPGKQVFHALTDFSRYKEWVPGCEHCDVTSSSGNVTETRIVVSSMKRIEMTLRFEAQPSSSLGFRMTRSKDLKAYSGTYRLLEAADGRGTVVVAELEIDPGGMAPRFMVDKFARKMIDETGAALKKFVSSSDVATAFAARLAKTAAAPKARRPKRILRVVKTSQGYRVWLLGETFTVRSQAG